MQQSNEKQTKNKPRKDQKKGRIDPRRQQQANKAGNRGAGGQSGNTGQQQGNKSQSMDNNDLAENMGSGKRQDDN